MANQAPADAGAAAKEILQLSKLRQVMGVVAGLCSIAFVAGFGGYAAWSVVDLAAAVRAAELQQLAVVIFVSKAVVSGAAIVFGFTLLRAANELTQPLLTSHAPPPPPISGTTALGDALLSLIQALIQKLTQRP